MNGIRIDSSRSYSQLVQDAVGKYGRPGYAFFTTYTFNADWFGRAILPHVAGDCHQDELATGLLVVCDGPPIADTRAGRGSSVAGPAVVPPQGHATGIPESNGLAGRQCEPDWHSSQGSD